MSVITPPIILTHITGASIKKKKYWRHRKERLWQVSGWPWCVLSGGGSQQLSVLGYWLKTNEKISELFLFWHKVVTQQNAGKNIQQNCIYTSKLHNKLFYVDSDSDDIAAAASLWSVNQMVFEWSIFDTPFTSEWESCLSFFSPRSMLAFWFWGQ